jgi:hypothetical protein
MKNGFLNQGLFAARRGKVIFNIYSVAKPLRERPFLVQRHSLYFIVRVQ